MDMDGLFGGLVGLAVLGGMMHCLNCGSPMTKTKSGHYCSHCGKRI